jgi:predicted nucleic acid-binding protein
MQRAGVLSEAEAEARIEAAASLTVARHELPDLLRGAWTRIGSLRVADALYVELAARLGTVVVTTDARLARATPLAELIAA